jgi:hypothetical protein
MSENLRQFTSSLQDPDAQATDDSGAQAQSNANVGQDQATPMSTWTKITIECISGYSENRKWVIWDNKTDPSNPTVVWSGDLAPDESTGPLKVYDDGWGGEIAYQRSDGARQTGNTVRDGDKLKMTN